MTSAPAKLNRIDQRFSELKTAGRTGLIPFVTAGDPLPEAVVPLMHALVEAGADLIELGMPFSDPMGTGRLSSIRASARSRAGSGSSTSCVGSVNFAGPMPRHRSC